MYRESGVPGHTHERRREALRRAHRRRRARPRGPRGIVRRAARTERRGQVDDDEDAHRAGHRGRGRARGPRLHAAEGLQAGARRDGRRAAARQPRPVADGRAEPARLQPPLPRARQRAQGRDRARARPRQPRAPARVEGLRAQRRHAPAAADRPRAAAPAAADPARRADRRPRPTGPPGAVGAHRPAAQRGRLDPDEHALHRGGRAPLRRGDDHVARQVRGRRCAARADQRARRARGDRGLRLAGAPRRSRDARPRPRLAHPAHRHLRGDPACQRGGRRARRREPHHQPRGRLRPADRRGDLLMAAIASTQRRLGRLERPALAGVMVREVVNFSAFWRSSTFSSTVDPTIYLLAFGFGFGSLVSTVAGYSYIDFVGTGIVATTVLFSGAFPAMYSTFVKYEFQHTYDAILAAPVDTEELVTAEALWISARTGIYGCVPMLVAVAFGLDPSWGMLLVPEIAALAGFGWACFGIFIAAKSKAIESFSYWQSGLLTPMFLVAGTFFPLTQLPTWAQVLGNLNPLFHCVQLVRHAVFGFTGWADVGHLAFLVGFALVSWRLAIRFMERKLIL